MPPRRSYKRSILGCRTCKQRKVKCDEVRPRCGQCQKHDATCDFASISSKPRAIARRSGNEAVQRLGKIPSQIFSVENSPRVENPATTRLMEMRLLHHSMMLTAEVVATIRDPERQHLWLVEVPSLALQEDTSSPLLELLLAISALHYSSLHPSETTMTAIASSYLDLGLPKFQAMVTQPTENNSVKMFLSSVLVSLYVLRSRQDYDSIHEYSVPTHWFRAQQGVRTIACITRPWIRLSKFKPLLLDDVVSQHNSKIPSDSPFAELLLMLDIDSLEHNECTIYKSAVKHLGQAHVCLASGNTSRAMQSIMSFPAVVSGKFIDLLEAKDPRSLIITAYFFGLTTSLKDMWWLQGVAEKEILGLFDLIPHQWRWAMAWPFQQIHHI